MGCLTILFYSLYILTQTLRKIRWPSPITRLTVQFTCGLISGNLQVDKKNMVILHRDCPYWDKVSLHNTKLKLKILLKSKRNRGNVEHILLLLAPAKQVLCSVDMLQEGAPCDYFVHKRCCKVQYVTTLFGTGATKCKSNNVLRATVNMGSFMH